MAKTGDDCYFFYNASCMKGGTCPFRHVEEALGSMVTCQDWRLNRCFNSTCNMRHVEPQAPPQGVPCYFENQPGGCTKQNCTYEHKFPRATNPHLVPPHSAAPPTGVAIRPTQPGWPVARVPGPAYARPPPPGPRPPWMAPPRHFPAPGFNPFPQQSQQHPPAYNMDHSGDMNMLQVEPVIINLHSEESDQDSIKGGSPVKPVRSAVPPSSVAPSNPLDYFLNAKPWVDSNSSRDQFRRSESPPFRRRRNSQSPIRRSPSPVDRSSPENTRDRRRSTSIDRQVRRRSSSIDRQVRRRSSSVDRQVRRRSSSVDRQVRRRSSSVDRQVKRQSLSAERSGSPEWRDRRRFVRRSRSPEQRRPRSPPQGRGRGQSDLRSRLKPVPSVPKLPEVKVTGSKIISTKKEKAEEETASKKEEETAKEPAKGDYEKEPVKSLEEIYRERALLSLMEAKRKKIVENKRKKWESLKQPESRKSESEHSDKSDKSVDEKKKEKKEVEEEEEEQQEEDSSSDSEAADIDLDADVDIELGEGELETREETATEESGDESAEEVSSSSKTDSRRIRSSVKSSVKASSQAKPSIKSRLGLRAVEAISKQASRESRPAPRESRPTPGARARSVKERLGMKVSGTGDASDRNRTRRGVVRLTEKGDRREIVREIRGIVRSRSRKDPMFLPQITIDNTVDIEERKTDIKQRLGLLEDELDSDARKRRKKDSLDEELFRLLQDEDVDIEESEMVLLTKKEKKKLLKKLLAQQGREDEYEMLKKRKKKSSRRKRDLEKVSDRKTSRPSRMDPTPSHSEEEEGEEDFGSAEEIELAEDVGTDDGSHGQTDTGDEKDAEPSRLDTVARDPVQERPQVVQVDPRTSLEIKREKEARLREALEPKTIADIRRERREKRAGGDMNDARKILETKGRIIVERGVEESQKTGPQVKVTFDGLESYTKRKLPRLGEPPEQNENQQPEGRLTGARGIKRDRQIYVPPTFKRTETPADTTKKAGPPAGREIINYGEVYTKKSSTSTGSTQQSTVEKPAVVKPSVVKPAITVRASAPSTVSTDKRPPLKLQRGPPKVEVKDATVKTFAEIMAEKKRKRLAAQQGQQKSSITHIDSGPGEDENSQDKPDRLSEFSPLVTPSSDRTQTSPVKQTIPVKRPPPTDTGVKPADNVSSNLTTSTKASRWKRKKTAESQPSEVTKAVSKEPLPSKPAATVGAQKRKPSKEGPVTLPEPAAPKAAAPTHVKAVKEPPPAEKSTSLDYIDLDDHLLSMSDDDDLDLELAGTQDHDDLMREIDELLA